MLVGQVAPLALAATPAPARALAPAASGGAGADYSRELKAAPAPAAPAFVTGITATKADSFTDSDGDTKAEPGQEVSYAVVVTNNGAAATGVHFSDTIDPNTTLVPDSLTASPLARDDSYNVDEDTTLNVLAATGVLDNDFGLPSPTAVAITSGSTAQGGSVTLNTDGSFAYTPPAGFDGTDSFTYTATNGNTPDNGGTVTITVGPVDDAPTAIDDAATVNEDSSNNTINVQANDTDPDGGTNTIQSVTQGANGSVAITNGGADLSYTPNANYCNDPPGTSLDSFTYTLNGGSTGTVNVTVTCVDDAATAVNDAATVPEDSGATTINVQANDTDPDGGTSTISSVTQPANGSVSVTNGGADLTYTPNANYCNSQVGGTPDSFTYTLSPGGSVGTVSVTVTCADDAPVANDDTASVAEDDGATAIPVLTNDTDIDGGTMTIGSVTQGTNGTVAITGGGTGLTYTPNANYNGSDSFTYTLNGGDSATVNVTVTEVNDAPSAANDTLSDVSEDSGTRSIAFSALTGNDSAGPANENSQSFNITNLSNVAGGSAVVNGTNVDFTPTANFCGAAGFTYTVTDNGTTNGSSDPKSSDATVSFNITCVNDAPSFTKGPDQAVNEDVGAVTVNPWATSISAGPGETQNVSFNVSNDNNALFTGGGQPAVSSTGVLTFTTAPNAYGVANVTVSISDDGSNTPPNSNTSGTQTFVITVTPVNDAPTAGADAWDFVGNTVLEVDAADDFTPEPTVYVNSHVLTNDNDPVENDPVSVTGVVGCADTTGPSFDNCATANGGSVNIGTDGRFVYFPKAGDTAASDSFQYVLTDAPTVGSPASVNGTVTLTREGRVWYVNNQAAAGGDGTSETPFDTLAEADTASTAGDTIYVFAGDGTTTGQNTAITLDANQRLIGQGVALTVPFSVNGGPNPHTLLGAGSRPSIAAAAGNAITITNVTGVEVRGLNISSAAGNAIELNATGTSSAGATIANNTISGAGLEGIDVNANSSGTTTADVQSNTIASAGNGFDAATGAAGTLNIVFSNNTGITSTAANGVVINGAFAGSTARIAGFSGNQVSGNTFGGGISVTSAVFDAAPGGAYDTVSGGDTDIGESGNRVGGAGVVLVNVRGDLSFTDLDVFAGGGAGLSAAGNAAFDAAGAAGLRVQVNAGAGTLDAVGGPALSATQVLLGMSSITVVSTGSASHGVNFDNTDGSTFSTGASGSSINTANDAATAFRIVNSTGTYTYNGTINSTDGRGVELINNAGATISFTNDITVSSGEDTAFNADTSGTVSVTDAGGVVNTLTTTTATALNFVNTTIGTGGINFRSISATVGPSNPAIVLNNTGATAGLSVLGTGANNSGGTITNAAGDAISLTNTRDVSLTELNIQNPGGSGVNGTQVTNFSITNSTIADAGDAGEESGIAFNTSKTTANNIAGTLVVTGNTITNSFYSGLDVQAGAGTITQANVSSNVITTTTNGFGINFVGTCTSSTCLRIDNANINQNNITNPRGAGIQVQVSSDTSGTQVPHAGLPGNASNRINITNNSIDPPDNGTHAIAVVTGSANSAARAKMNFLIECNGNNTSPCTSPTAAPLGSSLTGHVILVGNNGYSDMAGTVNNNKVTANHTVSGSASNAISGGNGVSGVGNAWTPNLTLTVTNNVLSGTDGSGILLVGRGTSGTANLKITGNNVGQPLSGNRGGINVQAGNSTSADDNICLNISGNTTLGSGTSPGINIRKEGAVANINDFGLQGWSGAPSPNADDAENYVSSNNPGSELGTSSDGTQKRALALSGDNYVGCNTAPAAPAGFDAATARAAASDTTAARRAARQKYAPRVQTPSGPRSSMDNDPRPTFGLINGKFVIIPEGQSAPSAVPNVKAPAATPAPATAAPATNNTPAPAAAPRTWSDMPAVRVIRVPQAAAPSDEAKDEDEEAKDDEEKKEATDEAAPAAPEGKQKPAKKAVRKNISYVGPLGAASDDTPRFVNASYSPAGDRRADRTRQVKAAPRAAAARPAAPVAGETVNVSIGDMANADSVTIRFRVTVNTPFTASPEQVSNQGTVTADGGISVQTDDPSVGNPSDPPDATVTPVDATRFISVNDAQAAEPPSGTADMTFTVSLSAPAPSAISVNFATSGGTATAGTCGSGGDYESKSDTINFATGEQVKTINVPVCSDAADDDGETLTVTLSGPSGGTISDGTATGTITANMPGTVLISELRTSGPGGPGDDFVELYNNSDSPKDISGYGLFKMGGSCTSTPVRVAAIPGAAGSNTTVIPARGHYLLTGSQYSLDDYGGTDAAEKDQSLDFDLEADANVGLFSTSDVSAISSANRLDAVGFGTNTGDACNLLRERTTLAPQSGSAKEHTFFRKMCEFIQGVGCTTPGFPKDTGDNADDFLYADTAPANAAGQLLGAPGPENMKSPTRKDHLPNGVGAVLLDESVARSAHPNRSRAFSDPVYNSPSGTLTVRRRFVNHTGAPISRMRFRIVELTTYPAPPGRADLRARTPGTMTDESVNPINDSATCFASTGSTTTPCTVSVKRTAVEEPPTQNNGGGLNSTLTVTLGTPLAAGASVNVGFMFGIQQTGTFRFYVIVEALP